MVNIVKKIVPESKWGIKCPYTMNPIGITVHNTANDATARNEIVYMTNNDYETSFHFAVDDKEAVQGLPLNRNGWHASDGGSGTGNRKTIAIEICYSKSGGNKFDKAEQNAAELIAYLLKEYGWDISAIKRHYDYAPDKKYCPHRTMDKGWDRFLNMVRECMTPVELNDNDVYYQVYTNKWLPNVKNRDDYAGNYGQSILKVYINSSANNNITYKVHEKGKKWLPEVVNRTDYAGWDTPIDGIMIKSSLKDVYYQVHTINGNWLPEVSGYNENDSNNGYAGIIGKEIDAIYIRLADKKVDKPKEEPKPVEQPIEEVKPIEKPVEEPKPIEEPISEPTPEPPIENPINNDIEENKNVILKLLRKLLELILNLFKKSN